jgi:hypothetical protein
MADQLAEALKDRVEHQQEVGSGTPQLQAEETLLEGFLRRYYAKRRTGGGRGRGPQ